MMLVLTFLDVDFTPLKYVDKSSAMQIVRSRGFLWLNPIAISHCHLQYFLGCAEKRDGDIKFLGRCLTGFCIGMINEDFHIAGI